MSSSLSNQTEHIDIQRPDLWTLELRLCSWGFGYLFFTSASSNSLITGEIRFESTNDSYLKTLENAIYDNPVLLLPFKQVKVVVESFHFLLMPPSFDDDTAMQSLRAAYPDAEGDFALATLAINGGVRLGFEAPDGVIGFVQRTFDNPPIMHHLQSLCEYYRSKQDAGTTLSRMFLYMNGGVLDVCAFRRGELVFANSFHYRSTNDAAFFALHAWQSIGLDPISDELQITGDKDERDEVIPILRKYINYVMPTIFPAEALKIGQDAVKAPYDLILLAICE